MFDLLRCPHCDVPLLKRDFDQDHSLIECKSCDRLFPVIDGITILCDDSKKNKKLEISFLTRFLGIGDAEIDRRIMKETKRIEKLKTRSSWEWDDTAFWDKKYREKWETREGYSMEARHNQWRDRIWQRGPLAQKTRLSQDGNPQKIILDVGSGEGQNMCLFGNGSYIAVDMSFHALKLAKYFNSNRFPNSLFILCPADRIPIKKNSIDIVTCFGILHHCQDKEKTLLPLTLLLRERGYLILHEPYERPSITPSFLRPKVEESPHEERVNRIGLKQILNGLECIMMEEGHSILFGFSIRFLRGVFLSYERIFRFLMKTDRVFLALFEWMHPALGPGDIRGVWQKK